MPIRYVKKKNGTRTNVSSGLLFISLSAREDVTLNPTLTHALTWTVHVVAWRPWRRVGLGVCVEAEVSLRVVVHGGAAAVESVQGGFVPGLQERV